MTPSPLSEESWKRYRSGMCPWNIRSWLLRSGTASDVPTGEWRQVCTAWGTGELESPPCLLWPEDGFGLLAAASSCRMSARRRGAEPADAHFLLAFPRCGWQRRSSAGAAGTPSSMECAFSPSSLPHLPQGDTKGQNSWAVPAEWHKERGTAVTEPAQSPRASANPQP